ncbi:MAG TPA: sugar phosphate isomerase/epimerase family protein [Gaiellaceae bacterium]|jgi:sugar phosphate isomerase/epimerase
MARFKYAYNSFSYYGEEIERSVERVAAFGYDAIELVGEPEQYDGARIRELAAGAGISVSSISSMYTAERDLCHPDPGERRKAVDYVRAVADFAAAAGAATIIVAPSAVMKTSRLAPAADERRWAVESIREGGEYAASVGVDVALEPWNRYETYFLNRLEQAIELWRETGLANGGVMGDTFHMAIEEQSIHDALRSADGLLRHVHLADSNRAVAGRGHTDFRPILQALVDIGYAGYLSFEVMAPSGDPMGIPEDAGPELFDADTKQAIEHLKALELEL